jgi:signal transduction histidine kinase
LVLAAGMASYLGRQMRLTRLKNDLIATVSHELKTPLASMRVLVDTLREGRTSDVRQVGEYLDLIARENERLSRLIDNFLTFSRMERNKRVFQLTVDVSADLPKLCVDRDAIETVIVNLLDNAWKHSAPASPSAAAVHKAVAVRAFATDGVVCIEVSDNGMGMSRRHVKRIFEKFYQVDQSLTRTAGGCGLGLAIVKFIVDAHGGTIDVVSQPGRGSTFTVRLPVETGSQ